jgi:F-type H+-transporting ATPase subunit delta
MTAKNKTQDQQVADVGTERVGRVYAEALLNAAEQQGQGDTVLAELQSLVGDIFATDPQFEQFLSSSAIGRDRKAPVIKNVFEGRASHVFTDFLMVLNQHDRLDLLRSILAAFRAIYDERHRRIRVKVESAVPLSENQSEELRRQLRQSFQWEPILEPALDPGLLGGLVVRVGDWVYDGSVRTRLETIRSQLIENSSYEIQSGRDRFCSANGN